MRSLQEKINMNRNVFGMTFVVLATIAICSVFLLFALRHMPSAELGAHGWVALVLGTLLSLIIGGGLSAILIISRRRGYDEAAHNLYTDRTKTD